jgi:HK97 family phage major capsid protein
MSALHRLLDERCAVAATKAADAADIARHRHDDPTAQVAAETALTDLSHYLQLREAVGRDAGPYSDSSPRSFVLDAVDSTLNGNHEARARLKRHAETRSTMSNFGGLVAPATIIDRLADSGHSPRPLLDLLAVTLPSSGATVDVPEVVTAMTAEDQTAENTAVTPDAAASTGRSIPIRTVFAESTLSMATLNRAEPGAIDTFAGRELAGAVGAVQESRVIDGSGASGQPTGLLNCGAATYSLASTAAVDLLDAIARTAAIIDGARSSSADLVVMHPRRWRWLLANAGDRSAAIMPTTTPGPVVGRVLGVDVVASPAMPTTLSSNQDRVIVLRRSDIYLAEAPATLSVHRDHTGSPSLTAKLRLSRYYAAAAVATEGLQVIVGAGTANPY